MEALELVVGQTLFIRGPRGYELTPDGEILFQEALEVEDAVYRTQRALKDRNTAFDGEVRITLPEDLVHFVTPTLETLSQRYAGLRTTLFITPEFVDVGRDTDIALRFGDRALAAHIVKRLALSHWTVYRSRNCDDPSPKWLGYEGLTAVPAVQWQNQHKQEQTVMRVNRVTAAETVLQHSSLVGLLPCHVGDQNSQLVRAQDPNPLWGTPLRLIVHEDLRRAARVRLVYETLTKEFLQRINIFEGTAV